MIRILALCIMASAAGLAPAQSINKCTDAKGKVTFQSEPCVSETVGADLAKRKREEAAAPVAQTRYTMPSSNINEPKIGMSVGEAQWLTWGAPKTRNVTETAAGKREQWVFPEGYLYFTNGILTAIQTSK